MTQVTMPQLGESVTEGTILQWLKQPGDAVALDDSLCEIETEKVTAELPSPFEGTMGQILVPEGETVVVGAPLCEVLEGRPRRASNAQRHGRPPGAIARCVARQLERRPNGHPPGRRVHPRTSAGKIPNLHCRRIDRTGSSVRPGGSEPPTASPTPANASTRPPSCASPTNTPSTSRP